MDKIVYIPSIVLGTALASVYCLRCRKSGHRIDAEAAGHCFLCGPSIVAGCLLLAGSVHERLLQLVGANIYIGLAGFLVILVSCQKLRKYLAQPAWEARRMALEQAAAGREEDWGA